MKKYLYQFFIALFAISTLTLVSCSDDEDDSNNGGTDSSFTVNGAPFGVHPMAGASNTCTNYTSNGPTYIQSELYPAGSDELEIYPYVNISIVAERFDPSTLSKGFTLNLTDGSWVEYVTGMMQVVRYSQFVSGKIIFQGFSNGNATFNFENVKYAQKDNDSNTITLNGTMTCEYTGI